MHMVRHQHICMIPAAGLACILGKPIQIAAIVFIGEKTRLAIIATLDDVDRYIRQSDAGATPHGNSDCRRAGFSYSLAKIGKPWSVPYYSAFIVPMPRFQLL